MPRPRRRARAGDPSRRRSRTRPPRSGRQRGKAARAVAPRSGQGEWEPASDRRDPVELLEEQAASRVPELVPIRYGRMLVSPFTFYRGAAYPMAADLAGAPRTGLEVQLCGDAHLSNFGAFAASDRRLVFSINDFDETLPGPFEWDVKRLVASFAVAGRDRGFDAQQRRVDQSSGDARVPRGDQELRRDVQPRPLVLPHRRRRDRRAGGAAGNRKQRKQFERNVAKARSKDSMRAFGEAHDGRRRRAQDRERPAAHRPDRGRGVRPRRRPRSRSSCAAIIRSYRRTLSRRPPAAARALPLRPRGAQGRRRGQRRHARLDRAHARPRRDRSAVPAAQGGAGVGARAVPGQEHVRQARPAGRRGPAADAGRQRHHARLDPQSPPRTACSRDFYVRQLWDGKGSAIVETMNPTAMTTVRGALRARARQGARPLRRRDRDRELPRRGRQLRPRAGLVRGGVRRPERARLRRAARGRRVRPRRGRDGL